MSGLDLGAFVEPLAEALFRWNTPTDPYFVIHGRAGEYADEDCYLPIARAALAAAAPLIEAAVRAHAAAEIEADLVRADDGSLNAFAMGQQHAARIARGADA